VLAPLLVAAAAALVVIVIMSAGSTGHRLWVNAPDATEVLAGQTLRMAGHPIGEIASVKPIDHGRAARLGLTINDSSWPLTRGTAMLVRWGGTISYLKRYIAVTPGTAGAPAYRDGDTLPPSALGVPLEFDSLINEFTPALRANLRAFINNGGAALKASSAPLRSTLERTPAAVIQANQLLGTLAQNRARLTAMITSTGDVINSIRGADPTVEQAVVGAAQTLKVTAQHALALQQTLTAAPGTFVHLRDTLGSADRTLDLATTLTGRIAPGVSELRRTIAPLTHLLTTVVDVGPVASSTLVTARNAAPNVTRLLARATQLMPTIDSVAKQALPELSCIRPYTPDIVSLFTNWTGFISSTDGRDHYVRINPAAILWAPTNVQPQTTAQAASMFPGLRMGFPRPPGNAAGQPWFQPQCGAGPDSINPFKDREARAPSSIPSPLPGLSSGAVR
jgi:ABC-type transporter Mla subunit MlaD